jgi:hypothetical protein
MCLYIDIFLWIYNVHKRHSCAETYWPTQALVIFLDALVREVEQIEPCVRSVALPYTLTLAEKMETLNPSGPGSSTQDEGEEDEDQ